MYEFFYSRNSQTGTIRIFAATLEAATDQALEWVGPDGTIEFVGIWATTT
jgi:hypothetical protein